MTPNRATRRQTATSRAAAKRLLQKLAIKHKSLSVTIQMGVRSCRRKSGRLPLLVFGGIYRKEAIFAPLRRKNSKNKFVHIRRPATVAGSTVARSLSLRAVTRQSLGDVRLAALQRAHIRNYERTRFSSKN